MTRVPVESTSLQVARETTPGVLPGSPSWREMEPDNVSAFGPTITTTPRRPISKRRQAQQGLVTDLEANVEFDTDVTLASMFEFTDGFVFAQYANWDLVFRAAPVLATGYTIPAATANQADKIQFVATDH